MDMHDMKAFIHDTVEQKREELKQISEFIYTHPEIGFKEVESAAIQVKYLREHGFDVREKVADMDTAFLATFRNGEGPHIAIFSEYDALPGLGHACGHNLISAASMGAGVAIKAAMEKFGVKGTVTVVGGPSEESVGGKIKLLDAGCLDDMDAAMAVHPTSAVSRVAGGCNTICQYVCEYHGKSAHSGNRPWDGVNALDAALLFFNAENYARQMTQDGVRVYANIEKGANSALGSIIDYTMVSCCVSAPSYKMLLDACKKIERCFEAGAVGTGCTYELKKELGYKNRIPNSTLGELFRANSLALGEPMMDGMPADNGIEDMGNVSHLMPAINPHMTIYRKEKISSHTDFFREIVGTQSGVDFFMLNAKTMADTVLDLLTHPELVQQAKEELHKRLQIEYGEGYEKFMR